MFPIFDLRFVRTLLGEELVTAADLSAFCLDYFPTVYRQFTADMNRTTRETLLLESVPAAEIVAALCQVNPKLRPRLEERRAAAAAAAPVSGRNLEPARAPYSGASYIRRPAEERKCRDILYARGLVVFYGPKLFGKTWLMQAALQTLRQDGFRTLEANVALMNQQEIHSLPEFLHWLASRLWAQISHAPAATLDQFRGDSAEAFKKVLVALPASASQPVVIAIENLDLIIGTAYQDQFMALLRALAEQAAASNGSETLQHLRWMLCISTAPALMVKNHHQSPFNNTDPIRISEFSHTQVTELGALYDLSVSEENYQILRKLVGGHPYLLRVLFYESAVQGVPLESLIAQASSDPYGSVFGNYLGHLRRIIEEDDDLSAAMRQVLRQQAFMSSTDPLHKSLLRLYRAGLIGLHKTTYIIQHQLFSTLVEP